MRYLKQRTTASCELMTSRGRLSYTLIRSFKRRTLEIMVPDSQEIRVTVPFHVSEAAIREFVAQKADWIARQLQAGRTRKKTPPGKQYITGEEFLFLGKKYPLDIRKDRVAAGRISFDGHRWTIRVPPQSFEQDSRLLVRKKLVSWYKREAKEVFGSRVFHFSRVLGLSPQKICVKEQKRIWGSCGVRNRSINLNWQLIFGPPGVIDYVVVHELAHLIVPNHSRRFWKKVAEVLPDYRDRQRWIREHRLEMSLPFPKPTPGRCPGGRTGGLL